jgi:hypothetical protein
VNSFGRSEKRDRMTGVDCRSAAFGCRVGFPLCPPATTGRKVRRSVSSSPPKAADPRGRLLTKGGFLQRPVDSEIGAH